MLGADATGTLSRDGVVDAAGTQRRDGGVVVVVVSSLAFFTFCLIASFMAWMPSRTAAFFIFCVILTLDIEILEFNATSPSPGR